jgi:hypothetical protein
MDAETVEMGHDIGRKQLLEVGRFTYHRRYGSRYAMLLAKGRDLVTVYALTGREGLHLAVGENGHFRPGVAYV